MKFSIITPTFNSQKYLSETIESVLSQKGDFEIEYILQDSASSDRTVAIFNQYRSELEDGRRAIFCNKITMQSFSEKDRGMYDAINKGFERATGDIFAWINSDDKYLPDAFAAVASTFKKFPSVEWLKGNTCVTREDGTPMYCAPCFIYNRDWIQRGIYGRNTYFIHQDSVFWRRSLWNTVGPIDANLRLAGDYWLWIHFAEHASLYSIDMKLSVFRQRGESLSLRDQGAAYRKEQHIISPSIYDATEWRIKLFFLLTNKLPFMRPVLQAIYSILFRTDQVEYIVLESGQPTMRRARSYIA